MGNIRKMAGTSEFWVSILIALGSIAVKAAWVTQDNWDHIVYPALVYVVSRIISKVAKKATGTAPVAVLIGLFALCLSAPKAQAEPVFKVYAGFNAVAFDAQGTKLPSDYELGAAARASLSPHISLTGGAWQGLARGYTRGTVGARATATDVNDQNFSIGLGVDYQVSSKEAIRPREWTVGPSIGWKPYPERWPRFVLGGSAAWGLTSNQVSALGGIRYEFANF